MPKRSSGSEGSANKTKLDEMVQAISRARHLATSFDNEFLIYLLDMAQLEVDEIDKKEEP